MTPLSAIHPVKPARMRALLAKELADLRQNPAVFLPAVLTGLIAIVIPFFVAVIVPAVSGERLADSSDFKIALEMYRNVPGARDLEPEAAIQAWIFQQFLIMLVITPIAGSMAVAAASVIGEKQARTLEPLLATPITTVELLTAKVLGAFIPAAALSLLSFAIYVAGALMFARPGVAGMLFLPRPLVTVFVLGPLAALSSLQLAVCVSSRVNDSRSAQQIGALVILPVMGLMLAQLFGALVLTGTVIAVIAAALVVLNAFLMWIGVILFQREAILTRWT